MASDAEKRRKAETRRAIASDAVGPNGRVLFDQHTRTDIGGKVCGHAWGHMAPPDDKPGVMHWCVRPMVEVPDPDGGEPAAGHVGKHRCTCGEYVEQTAAAVVVCRFPDTAGNECGQTVTGLNRANHAVAGSIMQRRPAQKFQIITSLPCGHVVRRGF